MASGQRKARILPQDLPPVIRLGENEYGYLTRYRIISEDRNRFSAWSPVYKVPAFDAANKPPIVSGDLSVSGNSVVVVWGDAAERPKYDVFVSFDGGAYFYHGTSPIHTYSFLNEATSTIDVKIQVESIDKEISTVLTICELSATIGP